MRQKSYSPATIALFSLAALVIFFAAAFSMQGFLTLGADLTANIETWPFIGWVIKVIRMIPNVQVVGFILMTYCVMRFWKTKGVPLLEGIVFLLGLLFIGGAETLANNVGAIAGFCLFLWCNVVQLSVWAGTMVGFDKSWGKALKPWIVSAYVFELAINIFRFPPYGDGSPIALFDDIRWGTLDPSLINFWSFLWLIVSIGAVEFTFVFFLKYINTVKEQMVARRRANPRTTAQSAQYSQAQQRARAAHQAGQVYE